MTISPKKFHQLPGVITGPSKIFLTKCFFLRSFCCISYHWPRTIMVTSLKHLNLDCEAALMAAWTFLQVGQLEKNVNSENWLGLTKLNLRR